MDIETEQLEVEEPIIIEQPEKSASPEPPQEENSTSTGTSNQTNLSTKQQYENFLHNLSNCVTKELIDSAAIDFLLNFSTKNNRKKLSRAIFGVQRTRLDVLPFYARIVAIINLVSRDVASELMQLLKNEFRYLVKKKDQVS